MKLARQLRQLWKESPATDFDGRIPPMEQAIDPYASRRFTLEEYFDLAEASEEKLEFRDGEILMMAAGTESHSVITANIVGELRARLKSGPCRVYDSNLRGSPAKKKKYYYPDVLVVCGERQFDANDPRKLTISNPTLIVEVLSDGTENFDGDEKFLAYIRAESLKEYVLVAQHTPRLETYFRQADGTWSFACQRQGSGRPPAEFGDRPAAERGVREGGVAGGGGIVIDA